ncbi:DsbA family oxidoreductase [Micromonospora sp. WMMD1120]|uniref:DsbA family oxidoreductase n=1 Tax=Micromonospora sp. WMMD1120 TaxID=3016106 RepID=UPI002417305E|nr:DsbA family oxidoreductase [Micromonospora sp. WMMD1120]MDG4809886.1 DsbA family oxidoreductase [Micromonospora sp. WMMD1120]
MRTLGEAEGLALNPHLARPVNTFDAHRLCHLAADHGVADTMVERLLHAYHTEGLDIAEPQTLERLGNAAGLDPGDVRTLLGGNEYAERVRADERRAAEYGVTGVPSLVIGGQPPVSGVQTPDELHRLLNNAWPHWTPPRRPPRSPPAARRPPPAAPPAAAPPATPIAAPPAAMADDSGDQPPIR